MEFKSVDEILDFAIGNEEKAADFYRKIASMVDSPSMKETMNEFVAEEMKHKEKLIEIKNGKELNAVQGKILDLKIGDYMVAQEPTPGINYQEALILAIKQEKAAFQLYNDLALSTDNEALRNVLLSLAQEEAKHKLKFETEYDENILREN
jgi:rubrerythrin